MAEAMPVADVTPSATQDGGNKNRLLDELNGALMQAQDDTIRREIKRLVEKVEGM